MKRTPRALAYSATRRWVAPESCPEALRLQGRLRAVAHQVDGELAEELRTIGDAVGRLPVTAHHLRATLVGVLVTEAGGRCTCGSRRHTDRCAVPRLREAVGVPRRRTLAREIAQVLADLTPTPADDLALRVLDVLRARRRQRLLSEEE